MGILEKIELALYEYLKNSEGECPNTVFISEKDENSLKKEAELVKGLEIDLEKQKPFFRGVPIQFHKFLEKGCVICYPPIKK